MRSGRYNNTGYGLGRNEGFTLVEAVVVVAIAAVMVGFAFPVYQNHVARTELHRCYNFLNSSRLVADNLIQLNNGAADGIATTDLGFSSLSKECDAGLSIVDNNASGNITLRGSANVPGQAAAVALSLVRSGANGTWSCSSNVSSSAGITPEFCP